MAIVVNQTFTIGKVNGKTYKVPSDLVVLHGDSHFLKLRGSHYTIVQLVCGGEGKLSKNPSLADSDQLKKLKDMVATASAQEDDSKAALFEDQEKEQEKQPSSKLSNGICTIQLNGIAVDFKLPESGGSRSDIAVKMQPDMLASVFDWLSQDCHLCKEAPAKRPYQKTGLFKGYHERKKSKKEEYPEEEEDPEGEE